MAALFTGLDLGGAARGHADLRERVAAEAPQEGLAWSRSIKVKWRTVTVVWLPARTMHGAYVWQA